MKRLWPVAALLVAVGALFLIAALCATPVSPRSSAPRAPAFPSPTAAASTGHAVVYSISGTASRVALTMRNATNGSEQREASVPYTRELAVERGAFLYISAQIVNEDGGRATCTITVDGMVVASATARGFARIATCSGSAP